MSIQWLTPGLLYMAGRNAPWAKAETYLREIGCPDPEAVRAMYEETAETARERIAETALTEGRFV